ncbi:hypothetical protein HKBW3S42_01959 [Candidatus Hakubella thermalkaliphila]|uniref:DUF433 domain-containing protein n=1 Tax=Candidatus Hakubella thermalkaliphila TaxID=2754717 RepID=A0A6V8PLV1_9ACTN|nr:hypothetical protein HKBW3S42_01959 [Candidatus Hakubella thermalkaliphila]
MLKTAIPKKTKHPYISVNPKISMGSPVISGTRVRVIDIAIEYDRLGLTPDQIVDAHPHLTLEAVHDALSYYYENQSVIDNEIRQRKEDIKKLSERYPSKLKIYID